MPVYDSSGASCRVFTFKEGLLSPVAHDLRLSVARFSIEVDEARSQVSASVDTTSLSVDVPMKDGAENPGALSDADKQKIAEQIRESVLHSGKYPTATFRSHSVSPRADGGYDIAGELTLHGVKKLIELSTRFEAGRQRLELTLHQPDFGITPFRAMLGTLKIQPNVKLEVVV
jgi:polyisoprenoid-binding protein YceI